MLFHLFSIGEVNHVFASGLMVVSLVIFYLSLMANKGIIGKTLN